MGPLQSTKGQVSSKLFGELVILMYLMAWCGWFIQKRVPWRPNLFNFIQKRQQNKRQAFWNRCSWRLQGKKMIQDATDYFLSIVYMQGLLTDGRGWTTNTTTNCLFIMSFHDCRSRIHSATMGCHDGRAPCMNNDKRIHMDGMGYLEAF